MPRALKRRLAFGVTVLALLTGAAIAAVSATGQDAPNKVATVHHARHPRTTLMLRTAADYLGIPASRLKGELRSGETLAQIADTTGGGSEVGLIEALVAAKRAKLAKASAKLPQHVRARVNRPLRAPGATRRTPGG